MTTPLWKSSKSSVEAIIRKQPADRQFHYPIRSGSMRIGLYAPKAIDDQTPHRQDELYIIASGSGWFEKGGVRTAFAPQDVFFVEADAPHRFEEFTADFSAWVIFWGPDGGEEHCRDKI